MVTRLFLLFTIETTDAIWLEGPRINNELLGTRVNGYGPGGRKWKNFNVNHWKGQFWRVLGSLPLSTRLGIAIAAHWVAFV